MDEPPAWLTALIWFGTIVLFAGISILAMRRMARETRIMQERGGPGIVAFELAGSAARAREVMNAWGPAGMAAAARQLRTDFVFIVGYTGLLLVLTTSSARIIGAYTWGWARVIGICLGLIMIVAGLLDVFENVLFLKLLRLASTPDDLQPQARIARILARIKFGIIFLVLGWLVLVVYPVVLSSAGRAL